MKENKVRLKHCITYHKKKYIENISYDVNSIGNKKSYPKSPKKDSL